MWSNLVLVSSMYGSLRGNLFACFSKTSFALLIIVNRFQEMFFAEVRPVHIRKIKLGIGKLVHQKITDAVLAARADHQFRVRHAGCVEPFSEVLFVDGFR